MSLEAQQYVLGSSIDYCGELIDLLLREARESLLKIRYDIRAPVHGAVI
jgi:hypothetical protein